MQHPNATLLHYDIDVTCRLENSILDFLVLQCNIKMLQREAIKSEIFLTGSDGDEILATHRYDAILIGFVLVSLGSGLLLRTPTSA